MYHDDDAFDLKFYTTPKATRMYGLYVKKKDDESPDSEDQIGFIKSSLLFIYQHCKENQIDLDQYLQNKSGDVSMFILHLREKNLQITLQTTS